MKHSNSRNAARGARTLRTVRKPALPGAAALLFTLVALAPAQSDAPQASGDSMPGVLMLTDERPAAHAVVEGFLSRYVGPVRFDHAAHVQVPGSRCADCHHEQRAHRMESTPSCDNCHRHPDGVVVSDANMRCVQCHSTPGLIRFSGTEGIQRRDGGMSTALHINGEAFHQLCMSCHQEANMASVHSLAPVSCISCHLKTLTSYEFTKD